MSLTFEDAVNIWPRLWAWEPVHRIAADYDCNQGRMSDIRHGRRHKGSEQEAIKRFGPPPPTAYRPNR